jgi:hypothetical protein
MNRIDRFQELIDAPLPPVASRPAGELVQPLRDLAEALEAKAHVGAAVLPSNDGRKFHLALWPRHRPGLRTVVVTVHIADGRGVVLGEPTFWFSSAEELTSWLESFVRQPAVKATLDELRVAETEPVTARLERENGMATLATLSPEQQEALDALANGAEHELSVELNEREPVPTPSALRRLDSAGLRFEIRHATLTGRTLRVRVFRMR